MKIACNHNVLSANAIRFASFLIAFLSAMGGFASTLPAQDPNGDNKEYALAAFLRTYDPLCRENEVVIYVFALENGKVEAATGVMVTGSVLNPNVGRLESASASIGAPSPYPWAEFRFSALNPGTAEIAFAGLLASPARSYSPATVSTQVIPCNPPPSTGAGAGASKDREVVKTARLSRLKISTTSTWSVGMEIVATIDETAIDLDDRGRFAELADVTWKTSLIGTTSCGAGENPTPPSKALLVGEIDKNNQLVVRIAFQPRDFSGFARCGPVNAATANVATLDPLTITVPTTGGTSTQSHSVTAKNGAFEGSVTVVVTRERK